MFSRRYPEPVEAFRGGGRKRGKQLSLLMFSGGKRGAEGTVSP
jgi:hypothetical protein